MISAVKADGYIKVKKSQVGNYKGKNRQCQYFALAIYGTVGGDFHFFKLMKPGYHNVTKAEWWHKPGGGKFLKVDFGGKVIPLNGLEKANRYKYKKICGYFKYCQQIW
jgi:hypothetical protein